MNTELDALKHELERLAKRVEALEAVGTKKRKTKLAGLYCLYGDCGLPLHSVDGWLAASFTIEDLQRAVSEGIVNLDSQDTEISEVTIREVQPVLGDEYPAIFINDDINISFIEGYTDLFRAQIFDIIAVGDLSSINTQLDIERDASCGSSDEFSIAQVDLIEGRVVCTYNKDIQTWANTDIAV